MALGGKPDDSAKMVCSRGCMAYLRQSPLKRQWNFGPRHNLGRTSRLYRARGGQTAMDRKMLQHCRSIYAAKIDRLTPVKPQL
jgi:hypothetical protein